MLILNRDLQPRDVPRVRARNLAEPQMGHEAEWIRIWRFTLSFDPTIYTERTGKELDAEASTKRFRSQLTDEGAVTGELSHLRASLQAQFDATANGVLVDAEAASLLDALLDAIYSRLSGGQPRPPASQLVHEPPLGVCGEDHGEGQKRFAFTLRDALSRETLFDRVAGILLREAGEAFIVSALCLYAPMYDLASDGPPTHTFMLLLQPRDPNEPDAAVEREYERLQRLVVSQLAGAVSHRDP